MRLIGLHNVENVMAAVTYGLLCGCSLEAIRAVLRSFPSWSMPWKWYASVVGYSSSMIQKGTNVDAVLKALEDRTTHLVDRGRSR